MYKAKITTKRGFDVLVLIGVCERVRVQKKKLIKIKNKILKKKCVLTTADIEIKILKPF